MSWWFDWIFGVARDTKPPTVPTGLTATVLSATAIRLAWQPSTDNVGVVGYRINRNSIQIATVTGTTFDNTGLQPATTYTYRVRAFDAAGKVSALSTAKSAKTLTLPVPTTIRSGIGAAGALTSGNAVGSSKRIATAFGNATAGGSSDAPGSVITQPTPQTGTRVIVSSVNVVGTMASPPLQIIPTGVGTATAFGSGGGNQVPPIGGGYLLDDAGVKMTTDNADRLLAA